MNFVYALHSKSLKLVKIGKSKNLSSRWKALSTYRFDEDTSFLLYCSDIDAQDRVEKSLHRFYERNIALDVPHADGHTECFNHLIIDDLKSFFKFFESKYPYNYAFIDNIKPFIGFPNLGIHNLIIKEDLADF